MNLYRKNLKNLKEFYRFIRFERNGKFLKTHSKLQELVKKNNKKRCSLD